MEVLHTHTALLKNENPKKKRRKKMEENKIIESKHYNPIKFAIILVVIGTLIPLIWLFLVNSCAQEIYTERVDWYQKNYPHSWEERVEDALGSKFEYTKEHMTQVHLGCHVAPIFVLIPFGACLLLAAIIYFGMKSYSLTVTDKRIYGRTWFGKRVDLPVDSVSAIGTIALFKGISVATSSGKISFLLIKNSNEVYQELNKLIVDRQEKKIENKPIEIIKETSAPSNAEELKKFKDLLDAGIITQEEFDAKKKQLLGF